MIWIINWQISKRQEHWHHHVTWHTVKEFLMLPVNKIRTRKRRCSNIGTANWKLTSIHQWTRINKHSIGIMLLCIVRWKQKHLKQVWTVFSVIKKPKRICRNLTGIMWMRTNRVTNVLWDWMLIRFWIRSMGMMVFLFLIWYRKKHRK